MKNLLPLLKQGSKSALLAAIVNAVISIAKGIAFFFTGNVAMFAETMHSLGDAANQFFVFIGSALSKKAPTDRFPNGFGRLVNLVLLGAVLIVGILSYETVKEGFHHIFHPTTSEGILISISVLAISTVLESFVLFKAMKEVLHETETEAKGFAIITKSLSQLKHAKPATKLVFMEDSVATSGGLLAIFAILISYFTPFHQAEGIVSVMIGCMMFFVVGKVFLDNAAGVLGEADEEMEQKIGDMIMQDPDVKDVSDVTVTKEGETLHVEAEIELSPKLTIEEAEDIKERIEEQIFKETKVADVIIEVSEDDNKTHWKTQEEKEKEKELEETTK